MPERRCIYCHAVGFVRSERATEGGVAVRQFSCGQCNATWRVPDRTPAQPVNYSDEKHERKRR